MGFLDNLENNLKNLESQDQSDPVRDQQQRHDERQRARAEAPWAEKLKKSPFASALLSHAIRIGHAQRTKVYMAWLGNRLRLEARGRKLELRPTPSGIVAVFVENNQEVRTLPVDLEGNPADLAAAFLAA